MVFAAMTKFFPAPGSSDLYCNKPSEYDRVTQPETFNSLVSTDLLDKLHSTGTIVFFYIYGK